MSFVDGFRQIVGKIFGEDERSNSIPPGYVRIPYSTLIDVMGDIIPLNTRIPRLNSSKQSSAAELWGYMGSVFDGTHCADKDFQKKSSISAYLAVIRNQITSSGDLHSITVPECHVRALIAKKDDMYLVARFAEQNGSTAAMPALPAKVNNPNLRYIFDSRKADPEKVSGRWNAQIIRQFAANIDMLQPFITTPSIAAPKVEIPAAQGTAPWGRSGRRPF